MIWKKQERQQKKNIKSRQGQQMEKQTYNVNEISVMFGMNEDTIRRGIANKEIPVIKIGRRMVIPKAWAEKQMGAK